MASVPSSYVGYLSFLEGLMASLLLLASIAVLGRLLYYAYCRPSRLKVSQLSTSLTFFLVFQIVGAIASIPYMLYLSLTWRPG